MGQSNKRVLSLFEGFSVYMSMYVLVCVEALKGNGKSC